jgi:dTDP-4-dehydrorhamnose 3,5-epimerase
MIHGVRTKVLRVIPDDRGRVMEILRADDDLFLEFGQVYVTTTYPQVVKAWHYHQVQTDHICAIQGMIKLVLYDPRESSPTKGEINEFFLVGSSTPRHLSWVEMYQRGGSHHP